jgi:uncharacterized membrane protein
MSFDYKLAIVLMIIGLSNRLLSDNRNWFFGYRSGWALKSHQHYNFANKIAGVATFALGLFYLLILHFGDDYLGFTLEGIPKGLIFIFYFVIMIIFIELRLRQKFKT